MAYFDQAYQIHKFRYMQGPELSWANRRITLEFSDGSRQEFELGQHSEVQLFPTKIVTTSWVKLIVNSVYGRGDNGACGLEFLGAPAASNLVLESLQHPHIIHLSIPGRRFSFKTDVLYTPPIQLACYEDALQSIVRHFSNRMNKTSEVILSSVDSSVDAFVANGSPWLDIIPSPNFMSVIVSNDPMQTERFIHQVIGIFARHMTAAFAENHNLTAAFDSGIWHLTVDWADGCSDGRPLLEDELSKLAFAASEIQSAVGDYGDPPPIHDYDDYDDEDDYVAEVAKQEL